VINATTKSGTNNFNGVASGITELKFNATPYTIGTAPRPHNNLRYNQVSFTIGSDLSAQAWRRRQAVPQRQEQIVFFFAYEPRWRQDF
jgi:hypothetical protein